MNEQSKAREALARVIAAHNDDPERAASAMSDYIDDPESISSPTLIADLNFLIGCTAGMWEWTIDDIDTTAFHGDCLKNIDSEFADVFADVNELCRVHSCDPEICGEDPEATH